MKNNYSVHKPLSFLMLLFKFILLSLLNLYHSIISLSVLRHFSLSRSLYSFFFSYIISLFSMYLFVIFCFLFMSITRYTSFIYLCIFLIPFIFVLASKRNNYTDSEINTIVFHLVPLITSEQQCCACSACNILGRRTGSL